MAQSFIAGIFGHSPVRPLQQHMAKVMECVRELPPFIEAAQRGDWAAAQAQHEKITDLEHQADALKKAIRLQLPNTLFMPVARVDLLEMLTMQDRIANKTKDISGLMLGRRMVAPAAFGDEFAAFVQRGVDAAAQADSTVEELDELFETGFRGPEVEIVKKMLGELDAIESDTDRMQADLRGKLYLIEKSLNPVDAMFLYRVLEEIGDIGDIAQRVGSRLQLLLAR
jgi:predicted phosphate transport protein (TIGR00153 family)